MSQSEKQTRIELIDPQLSQAGWNLSDHTQVGYKISADNTPNPISGSKAHESRASYQTSGVTDDCLYHPNGEILTVVEAKKAVVCARAVGGGVWVD